MKKHTLEVQFEEMLQRGIIPIIETELSNGDYLTVEIGLSYTPKDKFNGIQFSFDQDGKKVHFDGATRKLGDGVYRVPIDCCFDDLDSYLQHIDQDITEGFLLPNNMI